MYPTVIVKQIAVTVIYESKEPWENHDMSKYDGPESSYKWH